MIDQYKSLGSEVFRYLIKWPLHCISEQWRIICHIGFEFRLLILLNSFQSVVKHRLVGRQMRHLFVSAPFIRDHRGTELQLGEASYQILQHFVLMLKPDGGNGGKWHFAFVYYSLHTRVP